MTHIHLQALSVPKAGTDLEKCQDAWACNDVYSVVAIADGASDAFEAQSWARALVDAFVRSPPSPEIDAMLLWLEEPIQTWQAHIQWDRLTWYAEEKARRGAYATLLGVNIAISAEAGACEGSDCTYSALAVGDTCLFHVRDDALFEHFPIVYAVDFNTTPPLLSTRQEYNQRTLELLQVFSGTVQPGDLLILATDALAAWMLQQYETGTQPWAELAALNAETFVDFVETLRQQHTMRNDDTTLVISMVTH